VAKTDDELLSEIRERLDKYRGVRLHEEVWKIISNTIGWHLRANQGNPENSQELRVAYQVAVEYDHMSVWDGVWERTEVAGGFKSKPCRMRPER
jgi:hypothetical protein